MSTRDSVPAFDTGPIHKLARPLWRRIARIAGRVLGGLVLLVVLAIGFLHTPWGKSVVRGRIEHALAKKVNGQVHVGSLDYGFLFGSISLGDLEIRDAAGKKAIAIASIDVDLDRSALLDKALVIDELAIDGLAVAIDKHADGTTNLTGLFKPSRGKPALDQISIRKLRVTGAATLTKPDGTTIAVTDLGITGAVTARPAAHELELAISRIAAKLDGRGKQIDIGLDGLAVVRRADAIDLDIAKIAAGCVELDAIGAHVKLDHGKLRGEQAITIGKAKVDSKQLAALVGHEVLLDDVALDVSITGPADALALHGAIRTRDTSLTLDGTANVAAATPSYQLAMVAKGKSTDVLVPRGKKLPAVATDVRLDIKGSGATPVDLEAEVGLAVGPTMIDAIAVDGLEAKAIASRGTYRLDHLAAHGIGFDVAASGELGADKSLHARLAVTGSPAKAMKVLGAAGIAVPRGVPSIGKIDLVVTAAGKLDGELAVDIEPTRIPLAGGAVAITGNAKLDHKKLQIATTQVTLANLDLAALARLAGKPPKATGTLSGSLALTKTPTARHATFELGVALRDKPLAVRVTGTADQASATAHVDVRRTTDSAALAMVSAKLPLDAKGFQPAGAWSLSADVTRRSLREFAALLPERLRAKLPAGEVAVHAELAGSPARPTGTITLAAAVAREDIALVAKLAPSARGLDVTTDGTIALDHAPLATVHGTLAMPFQFAGKKLDVKALRAGLAVDAVIDVPERPLASLASLRAKLAELGGTVGGRIAVRGPAKTPAIDAALAWRGYRTAAGTTGETTLAASGTPAALATTIDHDGLKITADVDRHDPDRIGVRATMRAAKAPILPLLPAMLGAKVAGAELGTLDWNMDGDFVLVKSAGRLALDRAAVTGTLDVQGGAFAIPHSKRRYHDITLAVAGEPAGIRIKSLALHESDLEKRDRSLSIAGLVALDKLHPRHVDLTLAARDWLVFGTDKLGLPDAPRATATFDIGVAVDLASPVLGVDATIHSLALRAPDRQDRAHYQERASVSGDIIFVDRTTGRTGKLPVALPVAAAPRKRRPMDIRIHIPQAIRVEQTPLDVMARGELAVTVRETGVATRGTLTMDRGKLNLFGRDHALVDGSLTFSDEHPHGHLALTFERALPDFAKRELAAGTGNARITFSGSPAAPKVSLSGAANAAMMEVMAMYNAGRPLSVARPGLPASSTVEAPRGDQLFVLTFMASNLPQLLFLDRINAWADPYQGTYGQITNVEAEKYAADQKSRVRAVVRPTTPGRSTAELQYDRLLIESDRAALGVGVRAGDRLGGGVGLFFEWSSRD